MAMFWRDVVKKKMTINLNSYILFQSVTLNHSDCIFLWSLSELFQIIKVVEQHLLIFISITSHQQGFSSRFGLLLFYSVLYIWFSIKRKYLFIFILTLIMSMISWGKFRNELLITAVKKGLKYFKQLQSYYDDCNIIISQFCFWFLLVYKSN